MNTTDKQIKAEPGGVIDYLRQKMLKETLKYAAGQQMFCKKCDTILDWKKSVVLTAKKDDKSATVVVCTGCFNPNAMKALEHHGFTVEIDKL